MTAEDGVSTDGATKEDIYLVGIGGTGMGALAGLLKSLGHRVRGSDERIYPPMSNKLEEWGIEVVEGYDGAHLEPVPDRVVIGNVIRRENPEAQRARAVKLPILSMPQAVAHYGIADRHALVVTGTHGKTSVSAMLAHVLVAAGKDPGFLVGGALLNYPESFRVGCGEFFVVEGDEYDTAYFDKGPKFLHYRPRTVVITSLEYDHADIYASVEAIEASFRALVDLIPDDGHLVVWGGAERARAIARAAGKPLTLYDAHATQGSGAGEGDLRCSELHTGPDGLTLVVEENDRSIGTFHVAQWGDYSANNVLAVIGAARRAGLTTEEIADGLASFRGVKRRMEVLGQPRGVTVVDDFAHHPTAIRETLAAARRRWPACRLIAVFEPRSATTRRKVFQEEFVGAFASADVAIIGSHQRLNEIPESQRFSPVILAQKLARRGIYAHAIDDVGDIVDWLDRECRTGDVVMICSNGDFGGLHQRLLEALQGPGL